MCAELNLSAPINFDSNTTTSYERNIIQFTKYKREMEVVFMDFVHVEERYRYESEILLRAVWTSICAALENYCSYIANETQQISSFSQSIKFNLEGKHNFAICNV